MKIDWKARLTSKAWWVGIISLVVLLLQQVGLGQLADYIPKNYADIINTMFLIAAALGVTVDTSTPGISDQIIAEQTVNTINTAEEVQTAASTTSVNAVVSENSQGNQVDINSNAQS